MPEDIKTVFERHGIFVSHETMEKLETYQRLLLKWQKVINLIGPTTLDNLPERHFLDSAQLLKLIPDVNVRLCDMGSGAGFPGLVLAFLGVKDVHLIESDMRKATFLREVSRETGVSVTVHDRRAEDCEIADIDIFTARAFAPLRDILGHVKTMATPERPFFCLFMKGLQYTEELEKAHKRFNFQEEIFPSITDITGKIIKISDISAK